MYNNVPRLAGASAAIRATYCTSAIRHTTARCFMRPTDQFGFLHEAGIYAPLHSTDGVLDVVEKVGQDARHATDSSLVVLPFATPGQGRGETRRQIGQSSLSLSSLPHTKIKANRREKINNKKPNALARGQWRTQHQKLPNPATSTTSLRRLPRLDVLQGD